MQKVKDDQSSRLSLDPESSALVVLLGDPPVVVEEVSLGVAIIVGFLVIGVQQGIIQGSCSLDPSVAHYHVVIENLVLSFGRHECVVNFVGTVLNIFGEYLVA